MAYGDRFALDSERCEWLLALSRSAEIKVLSKVMGKPDKETVKSLDDLLQIRVSGQALIKKIGKSWALTPLGILVASWAREAISSQRRLFAQEDVLRLSSNELRSFDGSGALLLIGVQKGFEEPIWGHRNNPQAEERLQVLLNCWRDLQMPIYHVRHSAKQAESPLARNKAGNEFKDFVHPKKGEYLVEKTANSAFVGTGLEALLRRHRQEVLVIAGFTANHCVDATARSAGDLGFTTFVVSDATVAFDRVGSDGRRMRAADIHRAVMANLNQEFASVLDSQTIVDKLLTRPFKGVE